MKGKREISARDLFELMIENRPKAVSLTCKMRDLLIKPLGLKPRCIFMEEVLEETVHELIVGGDDVYMAFHVSVHCLPKVGEEQTVAITATVNYKKVAGAVYFLVIWGFYWSILKGVMKKVVKKIH